MRLIARQFRRLGRGCAGLRWLGIVGMVGRDGEWKRHSGYPSMRVDAASRAGAATASTTTAADRLGCRWCDRSTFGNCVAWISIALIVSTGATWAAGAGAGIGLGARRGLPEPAAGRCWREPATHAHSRPGSGLRAAGSRRDSGPQRWTAVAPGNAGSLDLPDATKGSALIR